MKSVFLSITPHDPIIARDGRPFGIGQGIRMRSLDWPYPSVVAGSLRTMLGKMNGGSFDENAVEDLKAIQIFGPLPLIQDQIYLPAPKDILVNDIGNKCQAYAIRPVNMKEDEGCDLPEGVLPAMLPESVREDFKPAKIPAFWSSEMMIKWLINANGRSFDAPPEENKYHNCLETSTRKKDQVKKGVGDFIDHPKKESRTHVRVDPSRGASEENMLFETIGLDLSLKGQKDGVQIAVKVESNKEFGDQAANIDQFHPLGGERRLAHWIAIVSQRGWSCPAELTGALAGKQRIRMVLTTPAIFSNGWKPRWLNVGTPPEAPEGLKLKLISACIDRWKPISGWSLEKGSRGPKAIRRLVPAGSVYFFDVLSGDAGDLAKELWMRPVSDEDQDRRDGFGLAVWGLWDFADEGKIKR